MPALIISEVRAWGPGGREDSFVELLNTTGHAVEATGWQLCFRGGRGRVVTVPLPARSRVPARGHLLLVGKGYSLGARARGDSSLPQPLRGGVQLRDPQGKVADAVGPQGEPTEFREGAGLPRFAFEAEAASEASSGAGTAGAARPQFSCVRRVIQARARDTGDNQSDFALVSVTGMLAQKPVRLGAPGPDGLSSPDLSLQPMEEARAARPMAAVLASDSRPPAAASPLAERGVAPALAASRNEHERGPLTAYGTLDLSCRVTNTTARPLAKLVFQVDGITAGPPPATLRSLADVRLLPNPRKGARHKDARPADAAGTEAKDAVACLEEPPAQPQGGGLNARAAAALSPALAPGASRVVRFRLGVRRQGRYRVTLSSSLLSVTFNGHTQTGLDQGYVPGRSGSAISPAVAQALLGRSGDGSRVAAARPGSAPGQEPREKEGEGAEVWGALIVIEGSTEDGVEPTGPASSLQLSSAVALSGARTLTLRFRTRLGAQAAPPRFEVQVNGAAVSPEGILYSADQAGVRLLLPEGSLRPGDAVAVTWQGLRDAEGLLSRGQAGPVKAS